MAQDAGRIQTAMTDITAPPAPNLAPEPFKPGITRVVLPNEVESNRAQRANARAAQRSSPASQAASPAQESMASRIRSTYQALTKEDK